MPFTLTPDATLAEADGWWFEVGCSPCRRSCHPPCRLLARQIGGHHRIGDVAERLSCEQCRQKPALVELVDDIRTWPPASGMPPATRITLVDRRGAVG